MIELWFFHSALPLAVYQCIKFHLIPFYTFSYMLWTSFLLQKLRREVTQYTLVIGLWFLHSAIYFVALYLLYQVSFIYLQYFQRYAPDKLTIAKIRMGNNSVITCDTVTILALCTPSDGHRSMYQVSFNSLLCFQRNALDKLFIAKIKKGSNSVNTGDRVMFLAFCNSPHGPLSVYQVSLNYLQYF